MGQYVTCSECSLQSKKNCRSSIVGSKGLLILIDYLELREKNRIEMDLLLCVQCSKIYLVDFLHQRYRTQV